MSDISKMNDKQLRNEVQLLRDELAIFKRKYEDIIYNLDTDNFSSRFVKEQYNMKTAIKVTAEGIETKVSKEDMDGKLEGYTTLEQTSEAIRTQAYASADLSSAIEIKNISQAIDKSKTYYISTTDGNGKITKTYYYYNDISKEWEEIVGGGIYTVFEQTPKAFKLKGDVRVDGSCVLTDSLKFNSSDRPVEVEYSVNGVSGWHPVFDSSKDKFMRLKIGADWSNAMKIVGDDGQPGEPGDAYVTAETVFNVLTEGGEEQGLFPAFYDGGDKLFINAEFIKAGQLKADRIDTENLSCTKLYAKDNYNGYSARLNGDWGDFGIFSPNASNDAKANSVRCMFGVYQSDMNVVNFFVYGDNFIGYNGHQRTTYPKGTWDFSSCDDIYGLTAKFA